MTKAKAKPKRRTPAVHITEVRKHTILKLLEQWCGRLAWDPFLDAVEQATGHRYTRQALWNHERIKLLWLARKSELRARTEKEEQQKGSLGVISALEKRDRLQREVDHLKVVINNYDQMFLRWIYNLKLAGYTDERLRAEVDKPLPAKPKEVTEPFAKAKAKPRPKRGATRRKARG